MKIKNRYLYIILSLFIIVMNLGYGKASEATLYIYFPFIYFSMYIYIVVNTVKDSFNKLTLLRRKSRYDNAILYIKKVFKCAILYSLVFVGSLMVSEILLGNKPTLDMLVFYMVQLWIHIVAWSMWGMVFYCIYSLTMNRLIGVIVTWICCDIPFSSTSILFRIGKYMYNAFQYLIENPMDNNYNKELLHSLIGVVIIIFLVIGTVVIQKRKNYIQKI